MASALQTARSAAVECGRRRQRHERAVAISDAYAKGKAKAWRQAVTAQLAAAESMSHELAKYVMVAGQRRARARARARGLARVARTSRRGRLVGGAGSARRTAECRELTLALIEDRLEGALEGDGIVDPRKVNPNPEGEVEDAGALDCFELSAGAQVDSSFGCLDPFVHCTTPGTYLASDCTCKPAVSGVKPADRCGYFMMCADGPAQEKDGQCSCVGEEVFVDAAAGGGPRPQPVDRTGGGTIDPR